MFYLLAAIAALCVLVVIVPFFREEENRIVFFTQHKRTGALYKCELVVTDKLADEVIRMSSKDDPEYHHWWERVEDTKPEEQ